MTKKNMVLGLLCLAFLIAFVGLYAYPLAGERTDTLLDVLGSGVVATLLAWVLARVT